MRRDEARAAVDDCGHALARRRDAVQRAGGRGPRTASLRELGLVTREELEELELRVAQLEHRLRLLERPRAV